MGSDSKDRPLVNVFIDESMETALSGFYALDENRRRESVSIVRCFFHFINHFLTLKAWSLDLESIFDSKEYHVPGDNDSEKNFWRCVSLLNEDEREQLRGKMEALTPDLIDSYKKASICFEFNASPSGEEFDIRIVNNDAEHRIHESYLKLDVAPLMQICLLLLRANQEDFFLTTRVNKTMNRDRFNVQYESSLIYTNNVVALPTKEEVDKNFLHKIVDKYQRNELTHYYQWTASECYPDYKKNDYFAEITMKGSEKSYSVLFELITIMSQSIDEVNIDDVNERNAVFLDYLFSENTHRCQPVLSHFVDKPLVKFKENQLFKSCYDFIKNTLLKEADSESDYEDSIQTFHAALYYCAQALFMSRVEESVEVEYSISVPVDFFSILYTMDRIYDKEIEGLIVNGSVDFPEFCLYISRLALMLDGNNETLTLQSVYKHSGDGLNHRLADSKGYALISHHDLMREYLDAYPPHPDNVNQLKNKHGEAVKKDALVIPS